jgi:demethylmenaquinone methyltransferase / 2-methoxy-6-polyprenyl-1,4-benzoquinol methylase
MSTSRETPSRAAVGAMFDSISSRYDLLNGVLSFGMDRGWRTRLLQSLPPGENLRVLDAATGTADVAIALAKHPRVASVLGVDISENMLSVGRGKVSKASLDPRVVLEQLQPSGEFDVATMSFGIRNVVDVVAALRALKSSLKPGGTLLILEFGEPQGALFSPLYRAYRKHVLPRVAGAVSGVASAYEYLDNTIATFPSRDGFMALVQEAGLTPKKITELSFGTVLLYEAQRERA